VIPFVDLKAQYHGIRSDIDSAIGRVLESGRYVSGPEVAAFEREFAAYCHVEYAIGVNSGASALHLALIAAGVGPGDEVITVPFTFIATAAAIWYTGATPVFVDIDPVSYTMDPVRIERAITPRTRAILPVHLYGQPADMDAIMAVAGQHGLTVIEDAAQAHGAEYKGRRAGSIGHIGCFSFYPAKNLGACGEGGAITTSDPEIARHVRRLRDWGSEQTYRHDLIGYNYRLDELQAAVLRAKLPHLEAWTAARRAHALTYDKLLGGGPIGTPRASPDSRHVYHIYAVRAPQRMLLQRALDARAIDTGIHYPVPVHLQPAFEALGHTPGSFPHAERAATEVLSLPMYAELTDEQIEYVAAAIHEFGGIHGTADTRLSAD
jgi:dTDP-4-amino-4,6-dideoxygalactose transaminase